MSETNGRNSENGKTNQLKKLFNVYSPIQVKIHRNSSEQYYL
jgi:hypothetical protein